MEHSSSITPAIKLSGITKSFGLFLANRNIDLAVERGTIHAIVGENGAGKSTLTRIIYGMHQPTSGRMEIEGTPVRFSSPRQAIRAGIGMVHQHFMLVQPLTVAENIVLGHEQKGLFSPLSMKAHKEAIAELACRHGLEIDSSATVSDLSVGQEQRVEILKLLYRRAQILILDEPTAVLSPPETETLFSTLRSLRSAGKTILFITHKLDEVLSVSDRVSVMKKGELVGTMDTETVTKEALARMMVGRNVLLKVSNPPQEKGKPVLVIDRLSCTTPKGETRLRRLSLTVHEGEVYGIAGVEGNGQSELLAILWGLYDRHVRIEGEVTVCGQSMLGLFPSEIAAAGVSFVPEDRLKTAVITGFDIGENLILGRHRERQFHHGPGFDLTRISSYTRETIDRFDIRCDLSSNPPLASLSGGNQQKIVLARELDRPDMKLLVLAQPTRGVDIGAIELIHRKIIDGRLKGLAVLLVSSELEEVISMSTRIGCLFKGSIRHEFSDEEIREGRAREADFEKKIGLHIT